MYQENLCSPQKPGGNVRIEAVVTCSHYSDFLEHTLVDNIQQLDGMVVVTSKDDKDTQRLCNMIGVSCVDTNVFYEKGDRFNKARGINLGLSHLRHDDWLLHLDADILLPHRFKQMLSHAHLDTTCLYGVDRVNTKTFDNWDNKRKDAHIQFRHGCLVNTPQEFSVGARLIHSAYHYCPIGYFQMWHSSANRRYPTNQGSAEHTDVLFAIQWDREHRVLLPEFFVYHLESEAAPMGANWKGRTTKPFKKGEKK
jgi:hypothetical protein